MGIVHSPGPLAVHRATEEPDPTRLEVGVGVGDKVDPVGTKGILKALFSEAALRCVEKPAPALSSPPLIFFDIFALWTCEVWRRLYVRR